MYQVEDPEIARPAKKLREDPREATSIARADFPVIRVNTKADKEAALRACESEDGRARMLAAFDDDVLAKSSRVGIGVDA